MSVTTLLLSQHILAAPLIGILNTRNLYLSDSINSTAILAAINSDLNEDVSTVFYHLEFQMMDALLQKIIMLVCDLLVIRFPAWSASVKQDIRTSFPKGFGAFKGTAS